jgi:hypothetical protein
MKNLMQTYQLNIAPAIPFLGYFLIKKEAVSLLNEAVFYKFDFGEAIW